MVDKRTERVKLLAQGVLSRVLGRIEKVLAL